MARKTFPALGNIKVFFSGTGRLFLRKGKISVGCRKKVLVLTGGFSIFDNAIF
jgi:hypothetical protein